MPAFHPRPDALPEEIGIFPLTGALLLPEGRLPLNIFEPRYLALVQDGLARGRMFGMIQPDPSARGSGTDEDADAPGLVRVGCLGRVTSFSETEDGRLLITLLGVIRFRVREELPGQRGFRRVRTSYEGWLNDLLLDRPPPEYDRAVLMAALRPYFRVRRIEANWDAIEQVPDHLLVTTLSMVCPFDPREKQALLEAPTPDDRAKVLVTLLQMEALGGPDVAPGPPS